MALALALAGRAASAQEIAPETGAPDTPEVQVQDPDAPSPSVPPAQGPAPPPAQAEAVPQAPATPQPGAPTPLHHLLTGMAYAGVSGFMGASGANDVVAGDLAVDASVRTGGMIGLFLPWVSPGVSPWVSPWVSRGFSLNAEIAFVPLNIHDGNGAGITRGARWAVGLSPLYHHLASERIELVVGPKGGLWQSTLGRPELDVWTLRGPMLGVNAGVFVRTTYANLGGLLSAEWARVSEVCNSDNAGEMDICTYWRPGLRAEKVVSLSGSILF